MKIVIPLLLIYSLLGCAGPSPDIQDDASMENVYFYFNGLKKAYLDTSNNGVSIDVLFHDPFLAERDSVKFYIVPIDQEFNHVGELQRFDMSIQGDTLAKKNMLIATDGIELPITFMYEIGAIYMSAPTRSEDIEWELNTVINDYFTFNVYNKHEEYQQVVDQYGLEPTVFIRE